MWWIYLIRPTLAARDVNADDDVVAAAASGGARVVWCDVIWRGVARCGEWWVACGVWRGSLQLRSNVNRKLTDFASVASRIFALQF